MLRVLSGTVEKQWLVELMDAVLVVFQYKVYVVPAEEFSMEYVDPKVLCVSEHGRFTDDWYMHAYMHSHTH